MRFFLLSAFLFIQLGFANAQIVYSDLTPDVLLAVTSGEYDPETDSYTSTFEADFDNNQIADFGIGWLSDGSATALIMTTSSETRALSFPVAVGQGNWRVNAFSQGETIGPPNGSSQYVLVSFISLAPDGSGNFPYGQEAYIGVRFNVGFNDYYGWVRAYIDPNNSEMTIFDYAYESSPNTPIAAGDMGSTVNTHSVSVPNFSVYPNPVSNELTLEADGSIRFVEVLDLHGRRIMQETVTETRQAVDVSQLPAGIYTIRLQTQDGSLDSRKFVKQ